MSFNQISGSLPSIFQTAFTGALTKGSTATGGASPSPTSLLTNSTTPGLGIGGTIGGPLSGSGAAGANPLDPLKGVSALQGLDSFVGNIMQTSALRKAGLLPPTGAAAQANNALGGLASLIQPLLAAQGGAAGADPAAAAAAGAADPAAAAAAPAADIASADATTDAQTLTALMGMLQQLQAAIGGTGAAGGAGISGLGGSSGGILAGPAGAPGAANPLQNGIFSKIGDNFGTIDTAISQTLNGIFSALPMAKL